MRNALNALRAALALTGALALVACSPANEAEIDDDGGPTTPVDAGPGPRPDSAAPDAPSHTPVDASTDASNSGDASDSGDSGPDTGPLDSDADGAPDALDCEPLDPTKWQLLAYAYRDGDGDTFTVPQAGTICSGEALPQGYSTVANGEDCDDTNPNVYVAAQLFADADGDGVGDGVAQMMCVGASIPPGYSSTGTDCAPADPLQWQLLTYQYRDADGDTYTVGMSGQICAGASLPAGYASQAYRDDCDDLDPDVHEWVTVYSDIDGDGVGAGAASLVCTDGSVPAGDSSSGTDCAPGDPTRWQLLPYSFVDRDGDGATVAEKGTVCSGAHLPPPYFAIAKGNDCDDANAALTQWNILYPDNDGDGAGTLPFQISCGTAATPPGYSRYGDDEDDSDAQVGPLPAEDILDLVFD